MKTTGIRPSILAAMFIGLTLGLCGCGAATAPESLRCEYQEGDDIVIDTQAPRLSWINNTTQTAWQVLVATDRNALKEGKADIWDSGKTVGAESHLVAYSGSGYGVHEGLLVDGQDLGRQGQGFHLGETCPLDDRNVQRK